eukprot:gene2472-13332_t
MTLTRSTEVTAKIIPIQKTVKKQQQRYRDWPAASYALTNACRGLSSVPHKMIFVHQLMVP